jgi:inorganic pyrophosphatase
MGFVPLEVFMTLWSEENPCLFLAKLFVGGSTRSKYGLAFWSALDKLASESKTAIGRPKGSHHPKCPHLEYPVYPVDYGCLVNASSMDGGGIGVWRGTNGNIADAIICTADLMKRDSEIKILIGCDEDEKRLVLETHNNSAHMKGLLIRRDAE